MKKAMVARPVIALVLASFLGSCVSMQDRTMTPQERAQVEVVGTVTVEFNSFQPFHIPLAGSIKSKAVSLLRAEASRKYQGNIDIRNVEIGGAFSGWNILGFFTIAVIPVIADVQRITASADVVRYNTAAGMAQAGQERLGEALETAVQDMAGKLPRNAAIAVLSVSSSDKGAAEYVISELEYRLVNAGTFTIVDRRRLDQIRQEQNFQMSGEVDDRSAVSIGNMLGASIVITGEISGSGASRRLVLKALDVRTARIVTMAREEF